MKIIIGILVLSALVYIMPVSPQTMWQYQFWVISKFIGLLLMIGSFIALLIMW